MSDAFEVREPEIEEHLRAIGKTIAGVLPKGWGFTLLLFSFGKGGSTFYLSNAERESMIQALREFIERQERGG